MGLSLFSHNVKKNVCMKRSFFSSPICCRKSRKEEVEEEVLSLFPF